MIKKILISKTYIMPIEKWENRLISTDQFPNFNYDTFESGEKTHPFSMICLLIEDDCMIAVGCDPISPMEFRRQNPNSVFKLNPNIPPRTTDTMYVRKTIYYATKVD